MKKNLLSVLVLVLVVVNIVMSAVIMISVIGTNQKTADLITSVASALNLELRGPGGETEVNVPLADTAVYDMTDLMVPLAKPVVVNPDGTTTEGKGASYTMFNLTLQMNTKHEDYAKFGEDIDSRKSMIEDVVNRVFASYTETECRNNIDAIRDELLKEIQDLFGSDFIFRIAILAQKYS